MSIIYLGLSLKDKHITDIIPKIYFIYFNKIMKPPKTTFCTFPFGMVVFSIIDIGRPFTSYTDHNDSVFVTLVNLCHHLNFLSSSAVAGPR